MCVCVVIPRCYVVAGAKTGVISREDVSRESSSYKRNIKIGRLVPNKLFLTKAKAVTYLITNNFHKMCMTNK